MLAPAAAASLSAAPQVRVLRRRHLRHEPGQRVRLSGLEARAAHARLHRVIEERGEVGELRRSSGRAPSRRRRGRRASGLALAVGEAPDVAVVAALEVAAAARDRGASELSRLSDASKNMRRPCAALASSVSVATVATTPAFTIPVEQARAQIVREISQKKFDDALKAATSGVHSDLNEQYFSFHNTPPPQRIQPRALPPAGAKTAPPKSQADQYACDPRDQHKNAGHIAAR